MKKIILFAVLFVACCAQGMEPEMNDDFNLLTQKCNETTDSQRLVFLEKFLEMSKDEKSLHFLEKVISLQKAVSLQMEFVKSKKEDIEFWKKISDQSKRDGFLSRSMAFCAGSVSWFVLASEFSFFPRALISLASSAFPFFACLFLHQKIDSGQQQEMRDSCLLQKTQSWYSWIEKRRSLKLKKIKEFKSNLNQARKNMAFPNSGLIVHCDEW